MVRLIFMRTDEPALQRDILYSLCQQIFLADKSDGYKSIDSNYAPLLSILVKMGGEAFSSFGELTI
jgi:hypothetical protein